MKRKKSSLRKPRCIVIAGPNGAGKTIFAREFLPKHAGVIHFVNADLIASGLSPLEPRLVAASAGERVMPGKPSRTKSKDFAKNVGIALRQAAKTARKTARMHGTPIYVSKNGKVVAIKP